MLYRFPAFLNRQIPVLNALSLGPGIAYVILGYLYDILIPALLWYVAIGAVAFWGARLHRQFPLLSKHEDALERWYGRLRWYYYAFFSLWTVIFVLYASESESHMQYIAIFTQIGASVVASVLLVSDRRLYLPSLIITMIPLSIYFTLINTLYGYVLAVFALVLLWVLYYSASSTNDLLMQTRRMALHDALTGLYNRRQAITFLQERVDSLPEGQYGYLFLIDLDYFKTINDSLGHDIGDLLLKEVARRMHSVLDARHVIARLGGDEFVIMAKDSNTYAVMKAQAETCAGRLLEVLKKDYIVQGNELFISASIGVSMIDARHIKASAFLKDADIAMYEVKAIGRDGIYMFDMEMARKVERRLSIISKLHFAIEHGAIELYFQPQADAQMNIIGCEVLSRWHDEELGTISPMEFIVAAEQTGQMIELGHYVFEKGVQTLQQWHDEGIYLRQFSINISMRQFFWPEFVSSVLQTCERYLDPSLHDKLVLEITETVAAENITRVVDIISELAGHGIAFSLDDFGTGYSSLSHLNRLPIRELKIDKDFIDNCDNAEGDMTMLKSIFFIAREYALRVVAEGVERESQFEALKAEGCDVFQGYYFAQPMDRGAFEAYLQAGVQAVG